MAKSQKSVPCSDWHRGWGIGHNKIGKLYANEEPDTYTWKGHCQGRHGQKWNAGSVVTFKANEDGEVVETLQTNGKSALPDYRDVAKAVITLKRINQ